MAPSHESVMFAGNKLRGDSLTSLHLLHGLQTLYLQNNDIKWIRNDSFVSVISLQILDLGNNKMTAILPQTFSSLWHLRTLFIYGNHIKLMNAVVFPQQPEITHMDLNNNQLQMMPHIGKQMKVLKLKNNQVCLPSISECKMQKVAQDLFKPMISLSQDRNFLVS